MIDAVNLPDGYEGVAASLERESILPRIWAHDYTVWKPEANEIVNRLGWLHAPFSMMRDLDRLGAFADSIRSDGFTRVLLLGMGGSSLAAQTLARTFGTAPGSPDLTVLDSTHPGAVAAAERSLELPHTLFLVATKSGTTPETLALFRYFFRRAQEQRTSHDPGRQFVAITDSGTPLDAIATKLRFRETFRGDPNIGGRYSALSFFGLVPAALLGVDVPTLLERARRAAVACATADRVRENPAARLGAILGAAAAAGRDKVTLLFSREIESLGPWVEQLVAESTGKERTGILPVVEEPLGCPTAYGSDRLFVAVSLGGDEARGADLADLERAGHPVVRIAVEDLHALGAQFFLWEFATAVAGHVLAVNPFNQPNVEAAKSRARETAETFRRAGGLPASPASPLTAAALAAALRGVGPDSYIALQAYLPPGDRVAAAFASLRATLRDRFRAATTFGYGPRFLHSTGQLHKGDRGNGRFIQLVCDPECDVPIPDDACGPASSLTFGSLIAAQAAGDRQALLDAGRSVHTFGVPADPTELIRRLAGDLAEPGPAKNRQGGPE